MAERTPREEQAAVLAWMASNDAGAAEASRHFSIPEIRIRQWLFKARRRGEAPQGDRRAPRQEPDRPTLTILPPPPEPKVELPPDVEKMAQGVVKLAMAQMIRKLKAGDVSVADCAKAIAAVTDRLDVFGTIAREGNRATQATPDLAAAMGVTVRRQPG